MNFAGPLRFSAEFQNAKRSRCVCFQKNAGATDNPRGAGKERLPTVMIGSRKLSNEY